jgi:hypothetical protein
MIQQQRISAVAFMTVKSIVINCLGTDTYRLSHQTRPTPTAYTETLLCDEIRLFGLKGKANILSPFSFIVVVHKSVISNL